jgi:Carboxypeptidase regulatory-like domain
MRKKRRVRRIGASLIAATLLCFFTAPAVFPQAQAPVIGAPGTNTTTKSIIGTVLDEKGTPVPRAVVLLKDMKTLQIRSFIAQDDGGYHFYDLSPDINYELRAQANGLSSKQKIISVFNGHKIVKLNLKLNKKLKT